MSTLLSRELHPTSIDSQFERIQPYATIPDLSELQLVNCRFEVHEAFAQGRHGKVYKATDMKRNLPAAFKVASVPDVIELERFQREANSARLFSYATEDVPAFLDAGVSEDYDHPFVFIAHELMRGGNLADKIKRNGVELGAAAIRQHIQLLAGPARAAAWMHEAGFVHRDLKPSNMYVYTETEGKLGDFGSAKLESLEPEEIEEYASVSPSLVEPISETDSWSGTPGYLAPEVVCVESGYTKAGDSFAFGVSLHMGVTGYKPTEKDLSERRNSYNYPEYHIPKLDDFKSEVPREIGNLVISCLEDDPRNRATMSQIAKTLEKY